MLISLLNPHDQQHTDTMRLMALGLLNIAFEVGGRSIGEFPALRMMVADHLCKHLFQVRRLPLTCPCPRGQAADPSLTTVQLARSDNPQLLSTSLRVITNVFDTMRPHLKLQQELFLSFLLDRLILPNAAGIRKADLESQLDLSTWARDSAPSASSSGTAGGGPGGDGSPAGSERASTPASLSASTRDRERSGAGAGGPSAESRELMLELLAHLVRPRHSMVDLWVNYDCSVEGEDLYERLVKFLSRGVYPPHQGAYQQDSSQLMCLDTILELVAHMAARLNEVRQRSRSFAPSHVLTASELIRQSAGTRSFSPAHARGRRRRIESEQARPPRRRRRVQPQAQGRPQVPRGARHHLR